MIANCKPNQVAAIHCFDFDHFGDLNKKYGKPVGDLVLKTTAARLQVVIRSNDTVARIGGDRFAVLQSEVKLPSDVARLAHRISDAIQQPILHNGQEINLTAGIGFSLTPRDGTDPDSLLAKAEEAVLKTKSKNRS